MTPTTYLASVHGVYIHETRATNALIMALHISQSV